MEPADRRTLGDRRARATRLISIFRLHGRRRSFRRAGEGRNAYVDCPSPPAAWLTLATVILSMLDALFTLLHLESGGREINPLMGLTLHCGTGTFLGTKTILTLLGAISLAIHERFRLGSGALRLAAIVYGVLFLYHLMLFAR